jgi:hypothetical protein
MPKSQVSPRSRLLSMPIRAIEIVSFGCAVPRAQARVSVNVAFETSTVRTARSGRVAK